MNQTIQEIGQKDGVILKKGFSLDQVKGYDQKSGNHQFIVIDDHQNANCYREVAILFAQHSRHRNVSVALLMQNCYSQAADARKYNRDILINMMMMAILL